MSSCAGQAPVCEALTARLLRPRAPPVVRYKLGGFLMKAALGSADRCDLHEREDCQVVKQERAFRTRRIILEAAAKVFEERGYQAATISEILSAAGVTKGALYFHFESKEQLAQGVLNEQDQRFVIPDRDYKLQELADAVLLHAYRLQSDPMVRAGVRLTMDQHATGLDRS